MIKFMKIQLDTETIRLISLFQQLTGVHVLDSYENDEIYFIVAENEYGLAVGKNGSKIQKAERVFKKQIKVFEYSPSMETFIKNIIPQTKDLVINDKKVEVRVLSADRSKVIGKGGYKIKVMEHFLKRLYDIESFKVK